MTTLITFLGRTPKGENGYRATVYEFDDGKQTDPVAFFGWMLKQRLQVNRLMILGTAGSMWDHLFEGDLQLGEDAEAQRLELIDAVEAQNVDQTQLDALAPVLSKHIGCETELYIIPYCRNEDEQIELLRLMADHVQEGERVHLDVTHGFRHLPMLALLAALHLRIARHAIIDDIWYGSFDPDTGRAPVYRLGGLLRIAEWLQALHTFDKDGDYGVFVPLLRADGLSQDKAEALERASHGENTLNFSQARQGLTTTMNSLHGLGGLAALYTSLLKERIDWIREQDDAKRLSRLTRQALEQGDYMRAAILLPRAFLERLKRHNESTVDYKVLEDIEKEYRRGERGFMELSEDYEKAKKIRNALAHGSRPKDTATCSALKNPKTLKKELDRLVKVLLP